MSIAVIVSKPSIVHALLPVLRRHYPQETFWFPCVLLEGFYHPPLPRGLRWADYPRIEPMDEVTAYRARPLGEKNFGPLLLCAEPGQYPKRSADAPDYEAVIAQADSVYLAVDPSPRSCWAAELLRQRNCAPEAPWHAWLFNDLTSDTLARTLAQADTDDARVRLHARAEQGRVRAYLDHQFAVNSLAILRRTAELAGSRMASPWVSKYQVQVLYILDQGRPPTLGQLLHALQSWRGTGAYHTEEPVGLGGPASRAAIVQQLVDHGWVESVTQMKRFKSKDQPHRAQTTLQLTDTGHEFLRRWLHPRCEDVDLPCRLEAWALAGLAQSQPSIDRYIRTWFGRQKRWLDQGPPELEG